MILDTRDYRQIASQLRALCGSAMFSNPMLNSRHAQIQSQLRSLASFFDKLADMAENTENQIMHTRPVIVTNTPGWNISFSTSGSAAGLLAGRTGRVYGSASWTCAAGQSVWSSHGAYASISTDALSLSASASASLRLMQNKTFNPRLDIAVQAGAHAGAAEFVAGYDAGLLDASIRAAGEVGSAYGEARCVLSASEQVFVVQAGAALARGECEIAIDLAGLRVTLGLSGSIGSAEFGASYSSKPGVWEVSANAGFLAGAGVMIRVEN